MTKKTILGLLIIFAVGFTMSNAYAQQPPNVGSNVQETLDDHEVRISDLELETTTLSQNVFNQGLTIGQQRQDIFDINSWLTDLDAFVISKANEFQTKISQLITDVNALRTDLTTEVVIRTNQVTNLQGQVIANDDDISTLQENVADNDARITTLEALPQPKRITWERGSYMIAPFNSVHQFTIECTPDNPYFHFIEPTFNYDNFRMLELEYSQSVALTNADYDVLEATFYSDWNTWNRGNQLLLWACSNQP